jgi:hypothetical protein
MTSPHEWLPLDTARDSFQWLVTGPDPLSLDGNEFDGLPRRSIPLDELRDLLLSKQCTNSTRDAVWRYLVCMSRTHHDAWTVACAGMALPNLAGTASWLAARYRGDRADIHATVLAGFLEALSHIDLDEPAVVVRLCWAARRAGQRALEESLDAPSPIGIEATQILQSAPAGHPDLVLARAIAADVITAVEADLVSTTRFGDVTVAEWAAAHDRRLKAAFKARDRAEDRLVAWLLNEIAETAIDDPVAHEALNALSFVDTDHAGGTPAKSRALSGRHRNGRPLSSRSVSKSDPDSGLLIREETTDSPRAARESEVRRCA